MTLNVPKARKGQKNIAMGLGSHFHSSSCHQYEVVMRNHVPQCSTFKVISRMEKRIDGLKALNKAEEKNIRHKSEIMRELLAEKGNEKHLFDCKTI